MAGGFRCWKHSAWWSRRHEFEADDYARTMSDGAALARFDAAMLTGELEQIAAAARAYLARIEALCRRAYGAKTNALQIGPLALDLGARRAQRDGAENGAGADEGTASAAHAQPLQQLLQAPAWLGSRAHNSCRSTA